MVALGSGRVGWWLNWLVVELPGSWPRTLPHTGRWLQAGCTRDGMERVYGVLWELRRKQGVAIKAQKVCRVLAGWGFQEEIVHILHLWVVGKRIVGG